MISDEVIRRLMICVILSEKPEIGISDIDEKNAKIRLIFKSSFCYNDAIK